MRNQKSLIDFNDPVSMKINKNFWDLLNAFENGL